MQNPKEFLIVLGKKINLNLWKRKENEKVDSDIKSKSLTKNF